MQHSTFALPPRAALADIPPSIIAAAIDELIGVLDERDGDADVEPNGDELDGSMGEDDFHTATEGGLHYPGCPIADPPERSFAEWQSLSSAARRAGHIDGRLLPGQWSLSEDAEDDDQDACLAADDDPARRVSDGLPGDSYDTEPNGDEGDYSEGAGGHCGHYGLDQSRGLMSDVAAADSLADIVAKQSPSPPLPTSAPPKPLAHDHLAPEDLPDVYASKVQGTCLEPVFRNGVCLVFSKSASIEVGDFVGVWFKEGQQPHGAPQRWVKRLAMGIMPGTTFPLDVSRIGGLEPLVILEQLNPPRRYSIAASRILALHKVMDEAKSTGEGTAMWSPPKT